MPDNGFIHITLPRIRSLPSIFLAAVLNQKIHAMNSFAKCSIVYFENVLLVQLIQSYRIISVSLSNIALRIILCSGCRKPVMRKKIQNRSKQSLCQTSFRTGRYGNKQRRTQLRTFIQLHIFSVSFTIYVKQLFFVSKRKETTYLS